ncbi:MAG: polysaccharide deacetylase family protein [Flavobacteriaceae bacterium]|nr:polysaccharide deacetylase family protein [Flavobacteriaceae bacterium]
MPSNLLFESEIKPQNIDNLIDDPFALCFYLLVCYEEYLPFAKDTYGRFSYQAFSLKEKVKLTEPLIDNFAFSLFEQLKNKFPSLKKRERKFQFINTIDIDHAWLYKNKLFWKNAGSLAKKIMKFQWKSAVFQMKVIINQEDDPYFIYPYIQSLPFSSIFFISFGKKGKLDTNHCPNNKKYRNLIKNIQNTSKFKLGLHPSYRSNFDVKILQEEKSNLENLMEEKIFRSRQHFIMVNLPKTYKNLLYLDIKEDFSMGFQDFAGFRAGTCTPFYWFDLEENKISDLKVYPFCMMDVTLKNYMQLSEKEAEKTVSALIDSVKKVNGTFISIFHNDSLSDFGEWNGWKSLYENLITKIND